MRGPPPRLPGLLAAIRFRAVSNLEKRGDYTPRRARERRAYQLVVAGGVAGTVGVVGLVLAAVGVIEASWPILALVLAAICVVLFRKTVGRR